MGKSYIRGLNRYCAAAFELLTRFVPYQPPQTRKSIGGKRCVYPLGRMVNRRSASSICDDGMPLLFARRGIRGGAARPLGYMLYWRLHLRWMDGHSGRMLKPRSRDANRSMEGTAGTLGVIAWCATCCLKAALLHALIKAPSCHGCSRSGSSRS